MTGTEFEVDLLGKALTGASGNFRFSPLPCDRIMESRIGLEPLLRTITRSPTTGNAGSKGTVSLKIEHWVSFSRRSVPRFMCTNRDLIVDDGKDILGGFLMAIWEALEYVVRCTCENVGNVSKRSRGGCLFRR